MVAVYQHTNQQDSFKDKQMNMTTGRPQAQGWWGGGRAKRAGVAERGNQCFPYGETYEVGKGGVNISIPSGPIMGMTIVIVRSLMTELDRASRSERV